jgi:hypothetical protein
MRTNADTPFRKPAARKFSKQRNDTDMCAQRTTLACEGNPNGNYNPYCLSFLRKVARLMPSVAAARLWLPS